MKNAALLLVYLVFVTGSNILLKLSAGAQQTGMLLLTFAAGNLAGFLGVLAYTGLLRTLPLHVAFPLSRGLVVIGVQIVGAVIMFGETVSPREALAVALVTGGILLVGVAGSRERRG